MKDYLERAANLSEQLGVVMREAHTEAVTTEVSPFAELALFELLETLAKLDQRIGRLHDAAKAEWGQP